MTDSIRIPIAAVRRLAVETGAPVVACRNALRDAGGDTERARVALAAAGHGRLAPELPGWTRGFGGNGPDHLCELRFDPDAAEIVRAIVRHAAPAGFRRLEVRGRPMTSEMRGMRTPDSWDLWVDEFHAPSLFANVSGEGAPTNVWNYSAILVGGGVFWIEHGYGADAPQRRAAEIEVLRRLLASDAPPVRGWSLEAGGQGYPCVVIAAGTDGPSLARHVGISAAR